MSTDIEKKIEEEFEKVVTEYGEEFCRLNEFPKMEYKDYFSVYASDCRKDPLYVFKDGFKAAALPLHSQLKELREVLDNQTELIKMRNEEVEGLREALEVATDNLKSFHEYNKSELLDVEWYEEERAWVKDVRIKFEIDKENP